MIHEQHTVWQSGQRICRFAARNVGLRSGHPSLATGRASHGHAASKHPAVRLIVMSHAVFALELRSFTRTMSGQRFLNVRQIFRMDTTKPLAGRVTYRFEWQSENRFPAFGIVYAICL